MSITVTVTADICPRFGDNTTLEDRILAGEGPDLIQPVRPLFERADVVIGNIEAPAFDGEAAISKSGPPLAMKTGVLRLLHRDMGFTAFTLANNHIYDHGDEGLKSTIETLEAEPIPYCGAGLTHEAACRPMVFTVGGKRVAVFNFAEGEFARAQYDGPGAARLESYTTEGIVREARASYDYTLVILHLGNEHVPIPGPEKVRACRSMVDAGADAVIGHHAHIPQYTETYKGAPICYSLGNFLFGKPFSRDERSAWHLATVAEVTFNAQQTKIRVVPCRQLEDLALHELGRQGRVHLDAYFAQCRRIAADAEQYRAVWEQQVRRKFGKQIQEGFLSVCEDLVNAPPDEQRDKVARTFNLFGCASHCERFATGLRLLYEGNETSDENAEAVLDALTELLDRAVHE